MFMSMSYVVYLTSLTYFPLFSSKGANLYLSRIIEYTTYTGNVSSSYNSLVHILFTI